MAALSGMDSYCDNGEQTVSSAENEISSQPLNLHSTTDEVANGKRCRIRNKRTHSSAIIDVDSETVKPKTSDAVDTGSRAATNKVIKSESIDSTSTARTTRSKNKQCTPKDEGLVADGVLNIKTEVMDEEFEATAEDLHQTSNGPIDASIKVKEESTDLKELIESSEVSLVSNGSKPGHKCPYCSKSLQTLFNLRRHIQSRHINNRKVSCEQCDKIFDYESNLAQHVAQAHSDVRHSCDMCEFTTKYRQVLRLHRNSVHLGKKPHCCDQCDSCFSGKSDLARHVRAVHEHMRPYDCPVCHKKFSKGSNRDIHYRSVHCREKPYNCDLCGLNFSHSGDVTRHKKTVHEGVKDFGCSECEYRCSSKSHLDRHWKSVHQGEKAFQCSDCLKNFSTKKYLLEHIDNIHRGVRPFCCEICDKGFSHRSKLARHVKNVHERNKVNMSEDCEKNLNLTAEGSINESEDCERDSNETSGFEEHDKYTSGCDRLLVKGGGVSNNNSETGKKICESDDFLSKSVTDMLKDYDNNLADCSGMKNGLLKTGKLLIDHDALCESSAKRLRREEKFCDDSSSSTNSTIYDNVELSDSGEIFSSELRTDSEKIAS